MPDRVRLSVVIATTHVWPFLKHHLNILLPQCEALGAEVLIGNSTGKGLPHPLPECYCGIRHITLRGASVFDLRAKATRRADSSGWRERERGAAALPGIGAAWGRKSYVLRRAMFTSVQSSITSRNF